MADLDRLLERMRQRREQRAAELAPVTAARRPLAVARGLAHPPGSTVFDPVTGQEGVVVSGGVQNVVVPAAQR